jgi:hypothetical protein
MKQIPCNQLTRAHLWWMTQEDFITWWIGFSFYFTSPVFFQQLLLSICGLTLLKAMTLLQSLQQYTGCRDLLHCMGQGFSVGSNMLAQWISCPAYCPVFLQSRPAKRLGGIIYGFQGRIESSCQTSFQTKCGLKTFLGPQSLGSVVRGFGVGFSVKAKLFSILHSLILLWVVTGKKGEHCGHLALFGNSNWLKLQKPSLHWSVLSSIIGFQALLCDFEHWDFANMMHETAACFTDFFWLKVTRKCCRWANKSLIPLAWFNHVVSFHWVWTSCDLQKLDKQQDLSIQHVPGMIQSCSEFPLSLNKLWLAEAGQAARSLNPTCPSSFTIHKRPENFFALHQLQSSNQKAAWKLNKAKAALWANNEVHHESQAGLPFLWQTRTPWRHSKKKNSVVVSNNAGASNNLTPQPNMSLHAKNEWHFQNLSFSTPQKAFGLLKKLSLQVPKLTLLPASEIRKLCNLALIGYACWKVSSLSGQSKLLTLLLVAWNSRSSGYFQFGTFWGLGHSLKHV